MIPTLQKYILREMGRTFLLTAIGLTAVLTTCGGVYNLTRLSNVGPRDMLLLMALVIPMCSAITLPIAALFSASATYGRLALDNEFVACRSSGINMGVLLIPCIAISTISAVITFFVFNFAIPHLMQRLTDASRESIMAYAVQNLKNGRHLEFQGRQIYAGHIEDHSEESNAIVTYDLAFIEQDAHDIPRVGFAESAAVKFDLSGQSPRVKADMHGGQVLDLKRMTRSNFEQEQLGPFELPRVLHMRPKYLSLGNLIRYRHNPEDIIPKLRQRIEEARQVVVTKLAFDTFATQLQAGKSGCLMGGDRRGIEITAQRVDPIEDQRSRRWIKVSDVAVVEKRETETLHYNAESAQLSVRFESGQPDGIDIHLQNGRQVLSDGHEVAFKAIDLQSDALPVATQTLFEERYAGPLLWAKNDWDLGEEVEAVRKKLRKRRAKTAHEFYSEINLRAVYSVSVVVLTVLGAALGVIFRGGQTLVAFGISFVPTLFVMGVAFGGKSMAKSESGLVPGLFIMWLGLLAVVLASTLVLKKHLPR
jgi:lipopolysaccharide export LptBFGC system permease protein LptF